MNAFDKLLKAAAAALGYASPMPGVHPKDVANCAGKRHYDYSHEAEKVVNRSIEQDPMRNMNLHHYKCPNCEAAGNKKWIVGHDKINASKLKSAQWADELTKSFFAELVKS